jgi:hypothetical protein
MRFLVEIGLGSRAASRCECQVPTPLPRGGSGRLLVAQCRVARKKMFRVRFARQRGALREIRTVGLNRASLHHKEGIFLDVIFSQRADHWTVLAPPTSERVFVPRKLCYTILLSAITSWASFSHGIQPLDQSGQFGSQQRRLITHGCAPL